MRIRKVECDQFAGLTNREIEFDQGLNIVIGDNESGKSTLIDLIYQLLFKDVKMDGRKDSDYIDKYFPKKVDGPQGDVIDGVIVFETPSGVYKLKKEWERGEGTCRLTLPDGTSIKGYTEINKILEEELKHRAGVYNEIVFASQKRKQAAIESIMSSLEKKKDPLSDVRSDLASALTQAALETGGVSIDIVEKTIKENMNDLIGRWDWKADAPEGGAKRVSYKNAWSRDAGSIVNAYYAVDEVRSKQKEAEDAERAVEEEKSVIQDLQKGKKGVEEKRTTFQKFRGILGQRTLLLNANKELDGKIKEQSQAFERWPRDISDVEKAKGLQKKLEHAQVRARYQKAEPAYKAYSETMQHFEILKEVDVSDITKLRKMIAKKQNEEAKLTGMNLIAKIKEIHSTEVNVSSVASGEMIDLSTGEVLISEAVNINIPGVLEMQLAPQGVDVEGVKQNLEYCQAEIKALLKKYDVRSLEELQEQSDAYHNTKQEVEKRQLQLEKILGDESWEGLRVANDAIPAEVETEMEIKGRIAELCGVKSVESFIGGLEANLRGYEEKYKSLDELKVSIIDLKANKDATQKKMDSIDDIPEEYQGIEDPDRYDKDLQAKISGYENEIEEHNRKLHAAERNVGDKSAEEYSDVLQEKEAVLDAYKTEYEHWRNIYNVFCELKDQTTGSPIENIEKTFQEYLQVITDGTLRLDSIDEQMSVQLASGSHALTYSILSDGTKDTISLAFRLAMLEHLYPEGDGLAVFDDPFTDMDTKRVEQSCKLIQKFAEKNQVIFVTCDPKYKKYLSGNSISVFR